MSSNADLILYIAAIFFPPFPVVVKRGCGFQLLFNLILDFFGWIPGILHAWYIIASTPETRHSRRPHSDTHYRPSSPSKYSHHSRPSQSHQYVNEVPLQQGYYAQGPPPVQGGYAYGGAPVHQGYAQSHQGPPPKY